MSATYTCTYTVSVCYNIYLYIHVYLHCTYIHMYIAIDSFMMTKLHKDIAMLMIQCVQSEDHTDTSTIKVTDTACMHACSMSSTDNALHSNVHLTAHN